jgi:hypothetical protein
VKIKKALTSYENFKDTYNYAYIGIPKGYYGLKKPFYGQLHKFKKLYQNFKIDSMIPTVLFMHGSNGLTKGETYRKWIVDAGFIFFAPNSFKIKNRPTYSNPDKKSSYEKVHKLRQAEIFYNIKKLQELNFIDKKIYF